MERVFSSHLRSDFLAAFLASILRAVAADPDHPVSGNAGQVSFSMINFPQFNYTARLTPPYAPRPHGVRWLGARQVLGVKGKGKARFRLLGLPPGSSAVTPGLRLIEMGVTEVAAGSSISSQSEDAVIDLWETTGPVVIEALTVHRRRNRVYWHFGDDLIARHPECGSLGASRLEGILDLARAMGQPMPAEVYEAVFDRADVQAKTCAIRSLLRTDPAQGFARLQMAIDGADAEYSDAAHDLFAALAATA